MIYNYTKCESVIAKIMADLDSTEVQQRTSDIREWIFEAVEKIGAPMQYISKETQPIPIIDCQVPLPEDLHILDGVAYSINPNGEWQATKTNNSLFKEPISNKHKHKIIHTTLPHDPENRTITDEVVVLHEHQPEAHKLPTTQADFYRVNGVSIYNKLGKQYLNEDPEYFIKPGWIVFNRKNGYAKIAYKAIATDERGYPLIPDSASYQEAVYWYCVMKLSFPKFMSGKLGGRGVNTAANTYFYIQQQWNFYRNQAYAEAMMPTADDMRSIKNDWHKLIPDWDSDDVFFKSLNNRQTVYNDYYNGY